MWTEHLQNKILERYRYTNLLDSFCLFRYIFDRRENDVKLKNKWYFMKHNLLESISLYE
jgi:hypothetical protein